MKFFFYIRFINLFDNPIHVDESEDASLPEREDDDKQFMQTYIETLKDRGDVWLCDYFVTQ